MNRTATATPKKNQAYYLPSQQSSRKFGNIINRVDKSAVRPKNDKVQPWDKFDKHDKLSGLENYRPEFHYEEKREKPNAGYKNKPYANEHENPVEPDNGKKETKNREFIAKVQNINKIHDQISSLLKFVKNGTSKSAMKDIEKTPQKSKIDQNRQKMIQQKIKQMTTYGKSNEKQNPNYFDLRMQQNEITPITISKGSSHLYNQQQKIGLSPNKNMNSDIENYRDKLRKYAQNSKHNDEDEQKKSYRGRPRIQKQKEKQKQLDKQKGYNYSDSGKQKWRQSGNSQIRGKEEGKKTYNYRMDNKQEDSQILTSKLVLEKQEGNDKYYVNYQKQISKVKQRIQSSSDMVKKMEQKYLKATGLNIDTYAISKNEVEQPKTPIPQAQRQLNRINKPSVEARSNFQLKVFSCQPEKEIKRDEIRRLIADRISQQIKLDQRLKDARELFNQCKLENKWKILQQKLKKLGFSFTEAELQSELAISSSQSNPFISQSKARKQSIIQELAERFAQSEQFWQKKLYQFLSRAQLQEIQFRIKDMDLDQRGYLTVEDLVCFINLYTSNFFRNRDIIYLFRRMMALGKNRNGIQYQGFLKIISHQ